MLVLLVLSVYSCRKRNELPVNIRFPAIAREDPGQVPTQRPPFEVRAGNQTHTVTPLYEYRIAGMVVSCGFSKNLAEHRNDYLNIMDTGIIWGGNLDPSIYRQVEFDNDGVWLHAQTRDRYAWKKLNDRQLSNNHLLSDDPRLIRQIKALKRGDVISIRGCLVSYSGRKSSVSRTDSGSHACEIIWVDELKILQDGTYGWQMLYRISLYGLLILLGARALFFFCRTPSGYRE
jgi:hypothetical protein